jgi:hypothetical protein
MTERSHWTNLLRLQVSPGWTQNEWNLPLLHLATVADELVLKWLLPGVYKGWASPLQNIWLLVIFKLLAGFNGVQADQLYGLNILDITLLALVGVMYLGLYMALSKTSKVWSLIAGATFPGMMLFMAAK